MPDLKTVPPGKKVSEEGEYSAAYRKKPLYATRDISHDIDPAPGVQFKMPVVTPEGMQSERIRSELRYKTSPSKKKKLGLEPEIM